MIRTVKDYEKLSEQYNKMLEERNSLIDDLSWYKAKVSRLEWENNNLKQSVSEYKGYAESHVANYLELKSLEHENKALRIQSNTYFDEWQNEKLTSQGLREQCKEYAQDASKYTTLTNHIRMKAENNPGVSRYIDLVNYIDRLERD